MALELIYTSAAAGVRPGSTGFCTVAMTEGLPPALISRLEALTAYRHLYLSTDQRYAQNPPTFIHYRLTYDNVLYDVLGRVCSCAPDHTGRSNKLAHFLVVSSQEALQLPCGPAAFRDSASPFVTEWNSSPRVIGGQHTLHPVQMSGKIAQRWAQYTGDAGWAGKLAQNFLDNPRGRTFILFDPDRHHALLELVDEAIQLLPEEQRWKVTYNTYGTSLPADLLCNWVFCLPGAEHRRAVGALGNVNLINLCEKLPSAGNGTLQECARTGQLPISSVLHTLEQPGFMAAQTRQNAKKSIGASGMARNAAPGQGSMSISQTHTLKNPSVGVQAPANYPPPAVFYPSSTYCPPLPPTPAPFIPAPPQKTVAADISRSVFVLSVMMAFLLGFAIGYELRPLFTASPEVPPIQPTSETKSKPADYAPSTQLP